jgi:hypothetical protein
VREAAEVQYSTKCYAPCNKTTPMPTKRDIVSVTNDDIIRN